MSWATPASHSLIDAALLLALLVHLAWVGAIAGTLTIAVAIDALGGSRWRRLASSLVAQGGPVLFSVAWLEVTAALALVLVRIRYPVFAQTGAFWAGTLVPLVAGLALLGLFARSLERGRWEAIRPAIGLAGIGLVLASCFLLCCGSGVLLHPEAWATSEPAYRFLLTWSGTGRFVEFTFLSLAATGLLTMALGNRSSVPADALFARRFGSRLALLSLLAWPLALLFTHFNLPAIALSVGIWVLAAAGLAVAGAAAWLVAGRLGGERPSPIRALLIASLALFGILIASDHLARGNALEEATLAGVVAAPAPAAALQVAAAPAGKLAAGKAVFDRVCHLCHRFDTKLIGPPFDSVVPKYRKDPASLKAFIRNPVKKDPKFPPMPKPAVNEIEIDAVAAYLLDQAKP
jgi:mono/diheme cytochrome c family protein